MKRASAPLVLASSVGLVLATLAAQPAAATGAASGAPPAVTPAAPTGASCVAVIGPGIPAPASVPSGIPGFHASWYGQSGYATLCPGQRATATVAFYNSGTVGWVAGRMGEAAYLGTWDPDRGAEGESALGGTGGDRPDTGWASPNRPAAQPADYVGPNQVAWFQFTIEAPSAPGTYRLYIRPVIEGATWMEDQGVYWEVRVVAPVPDVVTVTPSAAASGPVGWTREYTAVVNGGGCVDLAFVDVADVAADGGVADVDGVARLSRMATITAVSGAPAGNAFVSCASVGANGLVRFTVTSSTRNAYVRPVVFRDLNGNDRLELASEPLALGGAIRFLPADATSGDATIAVGAFSLDERYIVDAAGVATYRYDANDTFRRGSTAITFGWFELLLSRGDALSVAYAADPTAASTFTITRDAGRESPTLVALVDGWDGGTTQNDVGLWLIEPPTNVDGITYLVERVRDNSTALCSAVYGYAPLASVAIAAGLDERSFVDPDLAAGGYCYRVGVADLLTAQTIYAYVRVVVANPPPAVVLPRAVDARLVVSRGSPALIDPGDVIKIAFDKRMRTPDAARLLLSDMDGTAAELRCGAELVCTLNSGTERMGEIAYPLGAVVTMEVRSAPHIIAAGSIAGLQAYATILSGDLLDAAGNPWDLRASDDLVISAPD